MFNPMQLRIFRICVFSLLLTVSIALPAFAQSGPTGSLGGVVTDNSGAAVAGAKVNVSSSDTGLTRNTTADAEGRWQIAVLPTGNYKITVEAQGFKKAVAQAAVEAAVPRLLDLKLEVGEVTVEVQITDTAPLVTPNTSTTFRQLTGAELVQVPTSTRSFTHLLTAEAGVSSDLSPVLTNGTGNISPSVNGTRTTSTSLTFNGVDATNLTTNEGSMSDNISPAPETLAEVKLQTSLYDASTGRSGGGNFQLITKGGTNKFSGSAYYYGQHERLNANDYFFNRDAIDKPEARRNEGGFTIGGPVVKDKVHFFAGYQITRARTAFVPTASSQVVLPEALRLISGNRTAANIVSAFRSLNPSFALTEAQISPTILNLLNLKNPVTGDFFIPAPKAIGAGGERVGTDTTVAPHTGGNPLIRQRNVEPAEFEQDQFTLRMDDQLTQNNRLSGTFFFANFPGTDPFPDPSSLASPVVLRRNDRNRTVAISDIHTFGSALINEARFGYFHLNNTRSLTDPFIAITNDSVGIPNPANFYDKTAATTRLGHYVFRNNLSNLSFGGPNDSFNRRKQQTFSFADTMTWIKNNHNFRFGGEFKRHQYDSNLPEEQATEFEKWENFTQFLTGLATEADTQFGITDKSFRMRDLSFFFTDDWKLGKRTTLNVGVRWDWFGWPEEKDGRIGNVDFSKINDTLNPSNAFIVPKNVQTTGFAAIDQTIAVTAKANNNHTLKGQDLNNFQPRFGFAFSPFDNNRLVVRGGYGIFFDRPSASFINTVFSNYPFLREVEVTAPSRGVPITTAYSQQDPTLPFNRYLPNRIVWQSGGTFVIRDGTPVTRQANGTSNPVDLATGQPTLGNIAETFEFRAVDTGLRTPYIQQWNLGIQFEIAKDMLFEARYIGTKGTKLLQGVAFNQGYDLNSSNAPDAVFKRFNDAYARAYSYTQANNPGQLATLFPNGALRTASTERERGRGIAFGFPNSTLGGAIDYNLSNAAGAVIGFEARTPILGFNVPEALVLSSSANSIYNALQLGLTKRFSKGLQYNLAYTWSKSLDNNSSDPGSTAGGGKPDVPNTGFVVQGDQRNLANNRGVSDFDRTNRFSASFVYELPFAGSRFVKGWQVSGFAQLQTGTPFSIFAAEPEVGTAAQYTGVLRGSGGLYRSGFGRPSLCGTLDQLRTQGSDKTQSYFNASVLCSPLTTAGGYPNNQGFGNLGRNVLRAPYQKRFDLGFSKDTRITETVGFEFRWDIFNIFNNANFAAPANDLQDATDFGKITNTIGGPRVMQFGFKLKF